MDWVTDGEAQGVVAFVRTLGARRVLVAANLTASPAAFTPGALKSTPRAKRLLAEGFEVRADGSCSVEPYGFAALEL